ncbi:MAG: phytanoyl-CoA dioxygenase family protein [Acidimicrobiales bacterium]
MSPLAVPMSTGRRRASECRIEDFRAVVSQPTEPAAYPHAASIDEGVVVYRSAELRSGLDDRQTRLAILTELADALLNGPGIVVLQGAMSHDALDRSAVVFNEIIDEQRRSDTSSGDHFAKPGANDRIWNALEKLALRAPDVFCAYYGNDMLALACESWLGPGYQVTSQINVVNPGGEAQQPHRDYHLGFMTDDQAERFPNHIHRLSPLLTLQGAVAHCDMPVETGPTMYLPHSQKYEAGYLAWRNREFIDYFADPRVQLALDKGDAIFFNPAVFHAAGTNTTETVKRMANLLQISSTMGRAMEKIDRLGMCLAIYPMLQARRDAGQSAAELGRVIAASAEGYPFPADLDHDQPVDGLVPASQADLVHRALAEGWTVEALEQALTEQSVTRVA